jgi:hypothetical protein
VGPPFCPLVALIAWLSFLFSMVKIDFSNMSAPQAGMTSDIVSSIIDKTGVLLPLIAFTWIILAFIYHDRLLFTKPNRPNMTVPAGALPLIGHTYTMVKAGAKGQFERMQMWTQSVYQLFGNILIKADF